MRYEYYHQLYDNICVIFGLTTKELAKIMHVNQATVFNYKNRKDIPLVLLVDLCNELHIPMSYFVREASSEPIIDETRIGDKCYCEDLKFSLSASDFTPIEFKNLDFGTALTTNALRSQTEASKLLKVNFRTFHRAFFEYVPPLWLTVNRFIKYCETANLNFRDFVVDFNTPRQDAVTSSPSMSDRLFAATQRCMDLNQRNKSLVTINTKLRGENDYLKQLLAENGIVYNGISLA